LIYAAKGQQGQESARLFKLAGEIDQPPEDHHE